MIRQRIQFIAVLLGIILGAGPFAQYAGGVMVVPAPYVSEVPDGYGGTQYVIHNPEFSEVAVIGLLASNNNPHGGRWVDYTNWAWIAENQDVTSVNWNTRNMGDDASRATWQGFCDNLSFAGLLIDPADILMGYFVDYDVVDGNLVFADIYGAGNALDNAVMEGETRAGFYVNAPPMSDFALVVTADLNDNIVESVFVITGQVVPEPATLALLTLGGLALIRHR